MQGRCRLRRHGRGSAPLCGVHAAWTQLRVRKRRETRPLSRRCGVDAAIAPQGARNATVAASTRRRRCNAHSSGPRCSVASSSIQSSSSQLMPLRPGTLRVGPARYRGQDFGP